MNTLTEIKNQYAKDQGFYDWDDMAGQSSDYIDEYWTEICIRAQKAYGEKAAQELENVLKSNVYDWTVDEIITSEENLIR